MDGEFGVVTEQFVHKFQEYMGVGEDGVVNEQLWKKLVHYWEKIEEKRR